ncbi:hypothetical protein JHW43_008822 [Diplocarpon mali]|nr:hypothetical protein JHW43_008822 [Diplocarpon mali]
MSSKLYDTAPASECPRALPIGNGRLGAMGYGRTTTDLLQLNENSVWYGGPQDQTPDPDLVALYHNYDRYLLISSSRPHPKALPATLQGLWNPSFIPAWGSKYTININTQMNYWRANICNLSECEMPLLDLLGRMAERGKKTAQVIPLDAGYSLATC